MNITDLARAVIHAESYPRAVTPRERNKVEQILEIAAAELKARGYQLVKEEHETKS